MKVYKESKLIAGDSLTHQNFIDGLNNTIDILQKKGYEVEIHYSSYQTRNSNSKHSALILAYTEE